jgi:hypothetical protein
MTQTIMLTVLTFIAAAVGTATGFGTSTIMVPLMSIWLPLPAVLLFVGIIHLAGNLWKTILFRTGLRWKLILLFGIPGIITSFIGASLSITASELPLKPILGAFILLYVIFLLFKPNWQLPANGQTAAAGGTLSGLFAGFFGVGGAVRSAFLVAYNLPSHIYIFTSGVIALFIDITRVGRYITEPAYIDKNLLYKLLICVPASFAGAYAAKKFLHFIPKKHFRTFIAVFLALVAMKLIFYP